MALDPITLDAPGTTAAPAAEDGGLELSVVIPCLNEAETLETCIRKAQDWMARHGVWGEVVVGDNGSTDSSPQIAMRCGARVVHVPVRGYGAALYHATRAARGRYVIMGDADDSYDFSDLAPFLGKLRAGYDLVMGNRFRGGIKPGAMPWKNRYLGNPVLSWIGRLFFACPCGDFHCGLRGFSVEAFRKMDLRTTGMEYASEMVIKATLAGMRIAEVPTTLSPDGRSRPPHLRPWRDGWRHLRFMLLYSPRWLFTYPGLVLMALGLAAVAWLLPGPRAVAGLTFGAHALVYAAAAVVVGFQAVLFGFLARAFTASEGLLPGEKHPGSVLRRFSLEAGLVAGGVLLFAGLAGSLAALAQGGDPEPVRVVRQVVGPALALALGCQLTFASFFFAVLGLKDRRLTTG